jgi:hypothetical protein
MALSFKPFLLTNLSDSVFGDTTECFTCPPHDAFLIAVTVLTYNITKLPSNAMGISE